MPYEAQTELHDSNTKIFVKSICMFHNIRSTHIKHFNEATYTRKHNRRSV
jgi:hypothetical protein